MGRPERVFKYVRATRESLKEQLRGGIAYSDIPARAVCPTPAGKHVDRFCQARTMVGEFEKLVIAVACHNQSHNQFIPDTDLRCTAFTGGLEHSAGLGETLDK